MINMYAYLDVLLDEDQLRDVAEDQVLWVVGQNSEFVGDSVGVLRLLLL